MPIARPPLRESHITPATFEGAHPRMPGYVVLQRVAGLEFFAALLTRHQLIIATSLGVYEPSLTYKGLFYFVVFRI